MELTKPGTYKIAIETARPESEFIFQDSLISFSNLELLHAVVTCTLPYQRLLPGFLRKRRTELFQKIALVESSLEEDGEYLKKSFRTLYLDSSEKSMICYQLGLFLTKMLASQTGECQYLLHVHMLDDSTGGPLAHYENKKRTDLLGYSTADGSFRIWESRGRSNNSTEALEKGCRHGEEIGQINGRKPSGCAVCMTCYENSYLTAKIKESVSRGEAAYAFSMEEYLRKYYQPLKELFLESYNRTQTRDVRMGGRNFVEVTWEIPYFLETGSEDGYERRVTLGLPRQLIEETITEEILDCRFRRETEEILKEKLPKNKYVGSDFLYLYQD